MKHIKQFTYEETQKYLHYVGDSYTHARQLVPGNVIKIMDYFHEINKMLEEARKRYEN